MLNVEPRWAEKCSIDQQGVFMIEQCPARKSTLCLYKDLMAKHEYIVKGASCSGICKFEDIMTCETLVSDTLRLWDIM